MRWLIDDREFLVVKMKLDLFFVATVTVLNNKINIGLCDKYIVKICQKLRRHFLSPIIGKVSMFTHFQA